MPGEASVTFPALTIRGSTVRVQHEGQIINIQNTLELGEGARLEMTGTLASQGAVTVMESAAIEVRGRLSAAAVMNVDGSTIIADELHATTLELINGATLTTFDATSTEAFKLNVEIAETLFVDSTSKIDVSEKGYPSGFTTGFQPGRTIGSYGGLGGGDSSSVYGDFRIPDDWGSGALRTSSRRRWRPRPHHSRHPPT